MNGRALITRRRFMKKAAGVTAGAIVFPYIVASSALGKADKVAASERVVMGYIGMGGRGTANMRAFMGRKEVQVVAVCDVNANNRSKARHIANQKYGN